jgi:glycosyltransferase involved in cell wall biosynthesis
MCNYSRPASPIARDVRPTNRLAWRERMAILIGHPTGNPNAHHAALAHFERGRLDAFCVPWMPSRAVLELLGHLGPLAPMAQRLTRRRFDPLAGARKIQGRRGEFLRLLTRALGMGDEGLSYEANDWVMRTMATECARPGVTAVHAYEDCALLQFEEARRRGKPCVYDMPIGYYPAWEHTQAALARRYGDWLPAGGLPSLRYVRPWQKRHEMELSDLVLVPSRFVETTIREFHPEKGLARAPYGVDAGFWQPDPERKPKRRLRFIYAGQLSLRKGTPTLLEAWERAALPDAELELVGMWQLAEGKRSHCRGVTVRQPHSKVALRERYREADVFVFPSWFEGFGLVLLEAMACGLPAIATMATAGPDLLTEACGRVVPTGDVDALVENLQWFSVHRDELPRMREAARRVAERCTWERYRRCVADAVAPFV